LASFTEKRLCLHRNLEKQQDENEALKSQLGRLEHLANVGVVSCMIAHEINNLLTPIGSYASFALNNPEDRSLAEKALQKTARNCERASRIMESMLALSNGQGQEKERCRLIALVEEIFTCLCRDFTKDGIRVNIQIPEDLQVAVVPVQSQQVLMNLIINARESMLQHGGTLTIEAEEKNDTIAIEVRDTGEGIEPADLKDIFEPFFTTKRDGGPQSGRPGAGLGLAFCKRVIDAHNGSISAESKVAEGSTFTITLPKPQSGNS